MSTRYGLKCPTCNTVSGIIYNEVAVQETLDLWPHIKPILDQAAWIDVAVVGDHNDPSLLIFLKTHEDHQPRIISEYDC